MRTDARIYRGDSLLTARIPTPDPLLVDKHDFAVFTRPSMIEIVAATGVGKSLYTLGMALSISTGSPFLMWKAPWPRRVLIVDGEMIGYLLQKRLADMSFTMGIPPWKLSNLAFMARDWQKHMFMPRIDTDEGARMIKPFLHTDWNEKDASEEEEVLNLAREHGEEEYLKAFNPDVIIFDNAVTLFNPEAELDAAAWERGQAFLMDLRNRGITSILVHHAGRDGSQGRGHSSREDLMDVIVNLSLPANYDKKQGCRFDFRFKKGRSLFGEAATDFEASYNNKRGWSYKLKVEDKEVQAIEATVRPKPVLTSIESRIVDYVKANPACAKSKIVNRITGVGQPACQIAVSSLIKRKILIDTLTGLIYNEDV